MITEKRKAELREWATEWTRHETLERARNKYSAIFQSGVKVDRTHQPEASPPGCPTGVEELDYVKDCSYQNLEQRIDCDMKDLALSAPKQAMAALAKSYPELSVMELQAGILHFKGMTWVDLQRKTRASRGALSKRINRFYELTGWPRPNRQNRKGQRVQIDENRDAATTADTEENELSELES